MNAATQTNHFNLHTSGIGYLNRVRWVQPKQRGRSAQPFLACSVSALRGNAEAPDYTYFDLRVSGQEAAELVEKCMEDVDQNRKVVISFKVGDIYPHQYERDVKVDGRKTGEKEMACLIKGRLLLINTITVDGNRVYERQADLESSNGDAPAGDLHNEEMDQDAMDHEANADRDESQYQAAQHKQSGNMAKANWSAPQRNRSGFREAATA